MSEYVTIPLDIEGVSVDRVAVTVEGDIHIHVTSTVEGARCHRCGRAIARRYDQGREIKLRHLPILDHPTYILLRPHRYVCDSCPGHPKTTQALPWYEPQTGVTKQYEEHLLKALVNSTVQDVSRREGVGYDEVEAIIGRHLGRGVNWEEFAELPTLGIDEVSLRKGHRDFATIITVRLGDGGIRLLGVLEDRERATVEAFLRRIPEGLRDTVQAVCSDLYEGYTEAARAVFGDRVTIVADRFHVARLYRKVVDETRKAEMRRLKEALPEEEYKQCKGAMWLVRKPWEALDEREQETLRWVFKQSPVLFSVYLFARALTWIFEAPRSKGEAEGLLRAWMGLAEENGLHGFDKFMGTLDEKMDLITNYFIHRQNSGFVEGINHKIRVLMGRCYGLFDRVHLFQRLSLDLGGFEQFFENQQAIVHANS